MFFGQTSNWLKQVREVTRRGEASVPHIASQYVDGVNADHGYTSALSGTLPGVCGSQSLREWLVHAFTNCAAGPTVVVTRFCASLSWGCTSAGGWPLDSWDVAQKGFR